LGGFGCPRRSARRAACLHGPGMRIRSGGARPDHDSARHTAAPSSSLHSLGSRCAISLAQSFQGVDKAEPADESLFGAVLHAKESSDRLAPELQLELDGQLPLSVSGGRVVHRNRWYSRAPVCRLRALPEVLPRTFEAQLVRARRPNVRRGETDQDFLVMMGVCVLSDPRPGAVAPSLAFLDCPRRRER
jgi:hypothetical protein